MTLKELKQRVDTYYEMNEKYHDLEACIPNNKGGLGGTSVTKVKYASELPTHSKADEWAFAPSCKEKVGS